MKKLLLFLLFPVLGFSQSAQRINTAVEANLAGGGYALIVSNASVYVCQYNSGLSCTTPVGIYSDVNLTRLISQPLIANSQGVYQYYIAAGTQVIERVCAPAGQCTVNAVYVGNSASVTQGTVSPGVQYSPAFYTQTGSSNVLGGVTPFTGLEWFPGSAPPQAATGSNIETVLGFTPLKPSNNLSDVSNAATALSNLGGFSATPIGSQYNFIFNNGSSYSASTISTDSTGANLFVPNSSTSKINNNIFSVGVGGYSSFAAALSAAGSTGAVQVRSDYVGSDAPNNTSNLSIVDKRPYDAAEHFWSGVEPMYPVANYPLGNDLHLYTHGPADLWLNQVPLCTSTTVTLSAGVNTDILVGSTVNFTTATYAGIYVGGGNSDPNYEVASAFTVVDSTHITMTLANSHSGTTAICQQGTTFLDMESLQTVANNPPGVSGHSVPIPLYDVNRNFIFKIPVNLSDPWPYSGFMFSAAVTGGGTNGDYEYRNNFSSSTNHTTTSTGTDLLQFKDTGFSFVNTPTGGIRITPVQSAGTVFYGTDYLDSTVFWVFNGTTGIFQENEGIVGAGDIDFSGSTWLKLPVVAGFTSSANGMCGFDSTNGNYHCYNGADRLVPLQSTTTPTVNTAACVKSVTPLELGYCSTALTGTPPTCTCN